MRKQRGIWAALGAAALAAGMLVAGSVPPAGAQGQRQQIGSVSARADRSTVTLGKSRTEITLSGSVSIQTNTGDIMRAQRITLTVGSMPARPGAPARTDVLEATATGDVYFKTSEPVAGKGYQRVVIATADTGTLDRVDQQVALLRGVTVRSEDPENAYTLQNVAAAKIALATDVITADAPGGQSMQMNGRMTVTPESGPAYTRTVSGTARHGEVNQKTRVAVLTGGVDITAEEPAAAYTWRNAAQATIDFATQKVDAVAPNGQQMHVNVQFKEQPAKKPGK